MGCNSPKSRYCGKKVKARMDYYAHLVFALLEVIKSAREVLRLGAANQGEEVQRLNLLLAFATEQRGSRDSMVVRAIEREFGDIIKTLRRRGTSEAADAVSMLEPLMPVVAALANLADSGG